MDKNELETIANAIEYWGHLGNYREAIQEAREWIGVGFDAQEAQEWLDAGVFLPAVARSLQIAGIEPCEAGRRYDTGDSWGYLICNADRSIGDLQEYLQKAGLR